ncbi:MAG: hypothetical protein QXQ82_01180 [Candidatus Pacearchaeota archaeon]
MQNKRKKAQLGESIIWLYRILMIVIVIGVIIFIVVRHYSVNYDVRPLEASLVANKILLCLNREKNFSEEKIKNCITIDDTIFVNLTLSDEKVTENITLGNSLLSVYCEAKEKGAKGKHLPYCFKDTYLVDEKNLTLNIAISKSEKNV